MKPIEFDNAYYLKLGDGGKWEKSSIEHHKARIGWHDLTVEEINKKDWDFMKRKRQSNGMYPSKGEATKDINALRSFVNSTPNDIWITFHACQLWWCRLGDALIYKDERSKYRLLAEGWYNHDINGNLLLVNQIPGSLAKIQRFSGTLCSVAAHSGEFVQ